MAESKLWTSHELLGHEFPPPRWIVPRLLTSGLYLLVGSPKLGKSWLALSIVNGVAHGGYVLGKIDVPIYTTLYLALEDTPRRLQSRLQTIEAEPSRECIFATDWPQARAGVEKLQEMFATYTDLKICIVDTWGRLIGPHDANDYPVVTAAVHELKRVADEADACILLVHHAKKAETSDFLDSILGSTGLAAAADGALVLRRGRGSGDATLHVTGRDIEENQFALKFAPELGSWSLLGTRGEVQVSAERQEIYDLLVEAGAPMTPKAIAAELGRKASTIRSLLRRMATDGALAVTNGAYMVPRDTPERCNSCNSATPSTAETLQQSSESEELHQSYELHSNQRESVERESVAERLRAKGYARPVTEAES